MYGLDHGRFVFFMSVSNLGSCFIILTIDFFCFVRFALPLPRGGRLSFFCEYVGQHHIAHLFLCAIRIFFIHLFFKLFLVISGSRFQESEFLLGRRNFIYMFM